MNQSTILLVVGIVLIAGAAMVFLGLSYQFTLAETEEELEATGGPADLLFILGGVVMGVAAIRVSRKDKKAVVVAL